MTKSEYIKKRIAGLVRTIEPMVHDENKSTVSSAIELYFLRLITDVETITHMDISDMTDEDFRYIENI